MQGPLPPGDDAKPPALHVWDDFWTLRLAECPCDADFLRWLDATGTRDAAIFHFGTGGHHLVGLECARAGGGNAVLGITAAPDEHASFAALAIADPDLGRHYAVLFGDIYLVNPRLLPVFDVVTLFHLCEYRTEKNDAYGAMTDAELVTLLTERLRPGGHMLFYPGSFAWRWGGTSAADVVAAWEAAAPVERVGAFASLLVYRKLV